MTTPIRKQRRTTPPSNREASRGPSQRRNGRRNRQERTPSHADVDSSGQPLARLQRTVGNRTVQRLVRRREGLGLVVGPSDDRDEREADRVAAAATRRPWPSGASETNGSRLDGTGQRQCTRCRARLQRGAPLGCTDYEGTLQRDANGSEPTPSPVGGGEPRPATAGMGRPLPSAVRAGFEARLGHEFGDVRIHDGPRANELARAVNARAFTYGRHVFFGDGTYRPATTSGRRLLAHELVHVVQQRQRSSPLVQRAEIDDRPINCRELSDSTQLLDQHVNSVLASASRISDGRRRVEYVYQQLGVGSPYSEIEKWCERLPETHQNRVPIERSRYATTLYGRRTGSHPLVNAWLKGEKALGTVLKIGDTCIGSDKLGHFFQQGRDYFYITDVLGKSDAYALGFGEWLEGRTPADPAVSAWIDRMNERDWPGFDELMFGISFWRGVFGLSTTGVFSRADLEANRAGMEFYKRVYASPKTRFSARAYIDGQWNEIVNPSCFGPEMARLVAANDPGFRREFNAAVQQMVSENPRASVYAAKGLFEQLVEPYVRRYRCS
jgi:hypothetical protein